MIKEFAFFCSLAAADYSTSRSIIRNGGYELNPVLRGSESKQILFHGSKCLAQTVLIQVIPKKKRKKVMVIAGIIGGGFVINNLIQMNRIKR